MLSGRRLRLLAACFEQTPAAEWRIKFSAAATTPVGFLAKLARRGGTVIAFDNASMSAALQFGLPVTDHLDVFFDSSKRQVPTSREKRANRHETVGPFLR
jgi:hypothetical protein